jgi:hypothetical protein
MQIACPSGAAAADMVSTRDATQFERSDAAPPTPHTAGLCEIAQLFVRSPSRPALIRPAGTFSQGEVVRFLSTYELAS